MKRHTSLTSLTLLTLMSLAGAVMLGGCAGATHNRDGALADESYTPTGTAIPRKAPSRMDNITVVDKQSLENDRTMGSANQDGFKR